MYVPSLNPTNPTDVPAPEPETQDRQPYWLPDGVVLDRLPANLRYAVQQVITPAYETLVLNAPPGLEQSTGLTIVHLLWLELLDHMALGLPDQLLGSPFDPLLDRSEVSRQQLIDRHLRTVGAKLKSSELLVRIRSCKSKLHPPPAHRTEVTMFPAPPAPPQAIADPAQATEPPNTAAPVSERVTATPPEAEHFPNQSEPTQPIPRETTPTRPSLTDPPQPASPSDRSDAALDVAAWAALETELDQELEADLERDFEEGMEVGSEPGVWRGGMHAPIQVPRGVSEDASELPPRVEAASHLGAEKSGAIDEHPTQWLERVRDFLKAKQMAAADAERAEEDV